MAFHSVGQGLHHNLQAAGFSRDLFAEAGFVPIPSSWHRQAKYRDSRVEDLHGCTTTEFQIPINPSLLGGVESTVEVNSPVCRSQLFSAGEGHLGQANELSEGTEPPVTAPSFDHWPRREAGSE